MGSIIRAVGTYSPRRELTNQDLEKILALSGEETSDKWIVGRTGIRRRRVAERNETVASMAIEAAKSAFDSLKENIPPLDYLIVATNTHDPIIPNAYGLIHEGLMDLFPGRVATMACGHDTIGGCAGVNMAVMQADALINARLFGSIGVVASEKLSSVVDYSDRSTCILFGDGASFYILSGTEKDAGFMGHSARGDGSRNKLIRVENGEKVNLYDALDALESGKPPVRTVGNKFRLEGQEVFKYVCGEWDDLINTFKDNYLLNPRGIDFSDISVIAAHLANFRIFLNIDDSYPGFLEKCGLTRGDNQHFCNTSTASPGRRTKQFVEGAPGGSYLLKFGYGAPTSSCANFYRKPIES